MVPSSLPVGQEEWFQNTGVRDEETSARALQHGRQVCLHLKRIAPLADRIYVYIIRLCHVDM